MKTFIQDCDTMPTRNVTPGRNVTLKSLVNSRDFLFQTGILFPILLINDSSAAFINELKILSPSHWLNVYRSFNITASAPPKVKVHCISFPIFYDLHIIPSFILSALQLSPYQSVFLTSLSLYFYQFYTQQLVIIQDKVNMKSIP